MQLRVILYVAYVIVLQQKVRAFAVLLKHYCKDKRFWEACMLRYILIQRGVMGDLIILF